MVRSCNVASTSWAASLDQDTEELQQGAVPRETTSLHSSLSACAAHQVNESETNLLSFMPVAAEEKLLSGQLIQVHAYAVGFERRVIVLQVTMPALQHIDQASTNSYHRTE